MTASLDDPIACTEEYTREEFERDYKRVVARICEKHGITEPEIEQLIREHRYTHSGEDIEDEWIKLMAFARHAGWR